MEHTSKKEIGGKRKLSRRPSIEKRYTLNQINDIKDHLLKANIVEKLIYINIALYIITILFVNSMEGWFALSSNYEYLLNKPWTLFSYAFIHERFIHLFSNLIVLYFIGSLFLDFFTEKKLLVYYITGLLVGGIVYVLYYSFINNDKGAQLIGASAGVMAVLVGIATKTPHYALKFRFIGSVELWVLAAIFVALSALGIVGINAGSAIAHLGGAFTGYVLTAFFNEGKFFEDLFKRKSKSKKSTFRKVYRTNGVPKTKPGYNKKMQNQRKIDLILDKISKSGYDALTKEEKEFLFNQKED